MDSNNNSNSQAAPVAPVVINNNSSKGSKGLLAGTLLFGALAIAGVGFGIYSYLDSNKKSGEIADLKAKISNTTVANNGKTSNVDEVDYDYMDEEVRDVVDALKNVYRSYSVEPEESNSIEYVFYKDDRLNTIVDLDKAYGFRTNTGLISYELHQEIRSAIEAKFAELGFAEREDLQYMAYKTYENEDGIFCTNESCGYKGWIANSTIEFANELAEAYKDKTGKYPYMLNVKNPTIKSSAYGPYQNLMVAEANAASLFYRESPDAEWKYFTGTQAQMECSDYNTPELKKAFAGDRCYDTATQDADAIVKP